MPSLSRSSSGSRRNRSALLQLPSRLSGERRRALARTRACSTRNRLVRVLHLDTAREWRGGQTQLLNLLKHATHEARVALAPNAPVRAEMDKLGVEVLDVPWNRPWAALRVLRGVCGAWRPDLIAAHTSQAHNWGLLLPGPVVVHRRLDFCPNWTSWPKYRSARSYIAVSDAVRRVLLAYGVPANRVCVVHDGIDAVRPSGTPDQHRAALGLTGPKKWAVCVGALVPHKGHWTAVEALTQLPDEWHLCLIGEGPERTRLTEAGQTLGVSHRLHMPGHSEVPEQWMQAADVVLHPSTEEGMGQSVVEALVLGCSVVGTTAGGIPEVLGGHGRLVPPGNPTALARAWMDEAACPTRSDRQGVAQWFSSARMAQDTAEAYQRVLSGDAAPA